MLNLVISLAESSFIQGRQISDDIIIVQEMFHEFKTTQGNKGYVAWKIDLSKAYDRLNWKFVFDILKEIGIRGQMLKLIMECVSSLSYKTIVNGEV